MDNFSDTIRSGKVFTVMGSSGSGKSTFLHYLTGIIDDTAFDCTGNIIVGDRHIESLVPEKRRIGLLAQDGLLFSHMTMCENLLYAYQRNTTTKEKNEIIRNTLFEAQLDETYMHKYPNTLSGGQQSRLYINAHLAFRTLYATVR